MFSQKLVREVTVHSFVNAEALTAAMHSVGHPGLARSAALAIKFLDLSTSQEMDGGQFYRRGVAEKESCFAADDEDAVRVTRAELLQNGFLPIYFDRLADNPAFQAKYLASQFPGRVRSFFLRQLLPGNYLEMTLTVLQGMGNIEGISQRLENPDYELVLHLALRRFLVAVELISGGGIFTDKAQGIYLHQANGELVSPELLREPGSDGT